MPDHVQELSFLLGYLMLALLEGNGGGYTYRRVSWQENTGDGRYLRGGIWSGWGILSKKDMSSTEFW